MCARVTHAIGSVYGYVRVLCCWCYLKLRWRGFHSVRALALTANYLRMRARNSSGRADAERRNGSGGGCGGNV